MREGLRRGSAGLEEGVEGLGAILAERKAVRSKGGRRGRRRGDVLVGELRSEGLGDVRSVGLGCELLERRRGEGGDGGKGALDGRGGGILLLLGDGDVRGRGRRERRLGVHLGSELLRSVLEVLLGRRSLLVVLRVVLEGRREGVVALLGGELLLVRSVVQSLLWVVHGHPVLVVHVLLVLRRKLVLVMVLRVELLLRGGDDFGGDSGRASDSGKAVRERALVSVLAGAGREVAAGDVARDVGRRDVGRRRG